jgi:hypothetical protein
MVISQDILARWQEELARLKSEPAAPTSPEYWPRMLRAKVLGYLVERYSDPRRWNRYANQPSRRPAPGNRPSASTTRLSIPSGESNPLRDEREIGRSLERIREINVVSYGEYGIRVRREL